MDENTKSHMQEFIAKCYEKLERGNKQFADSYKELDMYDGMMEELVDVANYAFLEYMKIRSLKEKRSKL